MVAADQRPDQSRLIQATQRILAVQVVAAVVAIMLAVPDFIHRFTAPGSCTGCMDLRGVDFILLLMIFAPVIVALAAAALLLRPDRMWPSWLALGVNLVVVGSIPVTVLPFITGWGATNCSDMCASFDPRQVPPVVQHVQALLLGVPPLASLVVVVLLLGLPLIRPTRRRSAAPGT